MVKAVDVGFVPVGNTILVRLEHDTALGLVLPDGSDTKRERAKVIVVAVGQGRPFNDGTFLAVPCEVGDRVLLTKTPRCQVVELGGEEYMIVDADAVLGVYDA